MQLSVSTRPFHRIAAVICLALGFLTNASASKAEGSLDRVLEQGKIEVAVNDDYPPQSFQDKDGQWKGFDVGIAREIASRLGVSVEFVTPPWELVLSGRWRGRWQIAVNSMAPTEQRAARLDFVAAYYFAPVRAAVFKDDSRFQTIADLHGSVIGVCEGCIYEDYVAGRLKLLQNFSTDAAFTLNQIEVRTFPDEWAAAEALGPPKNGGINAIIASEPTLTSIIKNEYSVRMLQGHIFDEPLAIAVEKGDSAMITRVKEIIQQMRMDGTIKRLSEEWFGADYSQPASVQ